MDTRDRESKDIAAMLYCHDGNPKKYSDCLSNQTPSGALSRFLFHLANSKLNETPYEITLIAHSMGAIVANQMIMQSPKIKYKKIVYMGAAASITDFSKSVIPYMEQNKETNFYNLMLHPYAESGEKNCFDTFPPRGSLLEWLDDYFTEPRTLLDRRMGKYFNMIQAIHTINPLVRNRIYLRHFDVGSNSNYPQKHGEFDDKKFQFWKEGFWYDKK